MKRRAAAVRRVPIFSTGEVMVLLEDALPLRALLAPLDTCSEQLMEALEALQPDRASEFGFGSALHAVMDYLVRSWRIRDFHWDEMYAHNSLADWYAQTCSVIRRLYARYCLATALKHIFQLRAFDDAS